MLSPEEKTLAHSLSKSKETMSLLEKMLKPELSDIRKELQRNVAALDDAQYGQLMKALFLAESHVDNALNNLKRAGSTGEAPKKSPIAPV